MVIFGLIANERDVGEVHGATGWNLFTGFAQFPPASDVYLGVGLYLNSNVIGCGRADKIGATLQFETHFFHSRLNLQKVYEILLEMYYISTRAYLWGNHYTHFSGHLLEEKITIASSERILCS